MTRLSLVGLLAATIGGAAFAQPAGPPSVVGVWKVSEIMTGGPKPRPLTSSTGIVIFTQRHYSISQVTSDKPRPELPPKKEPLTNNAQMPMSHSRAKPAPMKSTATK